MFTRGPTASDPPTSLPSGPKCRRGAHRQKTEANARVREEQETRVTPGVVHAADGKTSDQAQQVGPHPLLEQMQLKPIPTALAHTLAKDLLRSTHTRAHAHVTPTHRMLTIKGRVAHRQPCACASLRVSARMRARARVKRGIHARPHGLVGNPNPPELPASCWVLSSEECGQRRSRRQM